MNLFRDQARGTTMRKEDAVRDEETTRTFSEEQRRLVELDAALVL